MDSDIVFDLAPFRVQYSEYARRLLTDLGLGDAEEPARGRLLAAINHYIDQTLTTTILENLDELALKSIHEMVQKGHDQEEVMAYIVASVPNMDAKIMAALNKSYNQMLDETRKITALATKHFELDKNPVAPDDRSAAPVDPLAQMQ